MRGKSPPGAVRGTAPPLRGGPAPRDAPALHGEIILSVGSDIALFGCLLNIDEYWQYVARAVLILGAVMIYQSQEVKQRE